MKSIDNDSAADHIGIEIYMEATGSVKNPVLYHVEQDIHIKVGTEDFPLIMEPGDAVKVTTGTNEKNVYLISGGETKRSMNIWTKKANSFSLYTAGTLSFMTQTAAKTI